MSLEDNLLSYTKYKELDFREIDATPISEIPLEIKLQIDNVLTVVEEAIEKLKISLVLPKILENPRVLQQYLENTDYQHCLKLVQKYRRKSQHSQNIDCNDYDLLHMIDYFQENHKILNVLPNWLDDIDAKEKCLLTALENVYQLAQQRFIRPAKGDLSREKRLHEVYLANEELLEKIKEAKHRLETKGINRRWKQFAISGTIKQLEDDLALIQYDNNVLMERQIIAVQRKILHIDHAFTPKQHELEETLKKVQLNYKKELETNLIKEKSVRSERNKLQLQLAALIKKYDQTIYEKRKEELLLQEEYDKQKQDFNNFHKEYEREEAIYHDLLSKLQREEKNLHEAKVSLFTYVCAARKLQKWWKAVQEKKAKAQKKAKSKVKGVKNTQVPVKAVNKKQTKKSDGKRRERQNK